MSLLLLLLLLLLFVLIASITADAIAIVTATVIAVAIAVVGIASASAIARIVNANAIAIATADYCRCYRCSYCQLTLLLPLLLLLVLLLLLRLLLLMLLLLVFRHYRMLHAVAVCMLAFPPGRVLRPVAAPRLQPHGGHSGRNAARLCQVFELPATTRAQPADNGCRFGAGSHFQGSAAGPGRQGQVQAQAATAGAAERHSDSAKGCCALDFRPR